jgi:hypothetical protein
MLPYFSSETRSPPLQTAFPETLTMTLEFPTPAEAKR